MAQEKYIYLIYLELKGELSSSEAEQLDIWLNQSSENRKVKAEIEQSLELAEDFKPSFDIDLDGGFDQIKSKLNLDENPVTKSVSIGRRKWFGLAAAVALLLVVVFLLKNNTPPTLDWQVFHSSPTLKKQISLSEGTVSLLNKNSQLEYPTTFLGKTRLVKLKGEAFFNVTENTKQPFQVQTDLGIIEVLGTEFNVRSYPDEDQVIVSVLSGKVSFKEKEGSKEVILTAGEEAIMDKKTRIIKKSKTSNPNVFSYMSGALSFRNTPLTSVFKDLEKFFNVNIDCQNNALQNCSYSMTQQKIELKQVLHNLEKHFDIQIKKTGEKYIISGGGC